MEKRKCKSSWGWRAHRPPMTLLRTEGTVAYIGGSDTLPAPLSREEEQALFLNMEAQPETARRTLIEHNLRLVVYIARKFETTGVGIEDLISIGAYKAGTNHRLDYAISKIDKINSFLKQKVEESFTFDEIVEELKKIFEE